MTVQFTQVTEIEAPVERVARLAASIDLHLKSMAKSRERAVAGRTSGQIGLGETVTWKATHFGIPFKMTSRITEVVPNERFVDEQVSGPFASLKHVHEFVATPLGTRMTDHIAFDAPFGPIGDVVEKLVLKRYMQQLISERNMYLTAEAEREDFDE